MVLTMLGNFRQVYSETTSRLSRPVLQDESYLSSIIDKWEDLFEKAQTVFEEHTASILQRKTRGLLIHTVWAKLRELMI